MDFLSKVAIFCVVVVAGVLLVTPYEAFLEGAIAFAMLAAAIVGFLMHPRREVYYVRTTVQLSGPDARHASEHDLVAVRVELVRLWLLFVPTFLAVAFLVFFAAGGPAKFSFLNWIVTSRYLYLAFVVGQYPPLLVLLLLVQWIGERRVMRDAEACTARSFRVHRARAGHFGHVSYFFMGEKGEYYGGHCLYFDLIRSRELESIVFHNVRKPELNKIATGFLFHRLTVLGRGVTDLDEETATAQQVLAETAAASVG